MSEYRDIVPDQIIFIDFKHIFTYTFTKNQQSDKTILEIEVV